MSLAVMLSALKTVSKDVSTTVRICIARLAYAGKVGNMYPLCHCWFT
jgi:hypothetical protein